jgi:ElaB/YqjD/DUF883 family membrane-anchored ribosome-binding protein
LEEEIQFSRLLPKQRTNQKKQKGNNAMEKNKHATDHDLGALVEDARALITATADVAGEKVGEARKRLATAVESAKEMADAIRDKTVAGAKAADKAVHKHPYQALAIGVGAGLLIGFLIGRRTSSDD